MAVAYGNLRKIL